MKKPQKIRRYAVTHRDIENCTISVQEFLDMKLNVEAMPLKDLQSLAQRVAQKIEAKRVEEKHSAKIKIAAILADAGLTIHDVIDGRKMRKGTKVAPKYRNPKDESQTWTGRGRPPQWFATNTRRGITPDKMAI